MRFRRDRDDERPEVVLPLLWFTRTEYRPVVAAPDKKTRPTGGPARAPARWPVELSLIAVEVAAEEVLRPLRGWRLAAGIAGVGAPAAFAGQKLREVAERHRASELGLTSRTAPQSHVVVGPALVGGLVRGIYLRGRRAKEAQLWPRALARAIIREVDRRRSWNAAMRAGPGSS